MNQPPDSTDLIAARGIDHILLGTDGSDESVVADEWARDIALRLGAKVTVVCAFESPRAFRKRGSIYLTEPGTRWSRRPQRSPPRSSLIS